QISTENDLMLNQRSSNWFSSVNRRYGLSSIFTNFWTSLVSCCFCCFQEVNEFSDNEYHLSLRRYRQSSIREIDMSESFTGEELAREESKESLSLESLTTELDEKKEITSEEDAADKDESASESDESVTSTTEETSTTTESNSDDEESSD
ncbi:MAG: hypothetical protein LBL38_00125, partial [Lactobacillales bacterium]|nr:hypothetical protein [Lactobacillales bacterium]